MLMDILGIVIGFCSIMLIFSLLVTALVHGTQASLNLRVRNLRNVIKSFMDQFPDIDTQAVLEKIDRRIPDNLNPLVLPNGGKLFNHHLKLSVISKKELMQITEQLMQDCNEARNHIQKEIERSFDYLEELMAQRFKQWMHQLAIGIAFLIAFAFQLNTFDLISNLNRETALRNQALVYAEQANTQDVASLQANANIESVSDQLVAFRFVLLEQGWDYYFGAAVSDDATKENAAASYTWLQLLQNWLGVICSAIFISLGAPFWFNSLKNVLNLRDKLAVASPVQAANNVHSFPPVENRKDHG